MASAMPATLFEVLIGPKRLKIGKMKATELFFYTREIEGAARDNMVNVPLSIIHPGHAGFELLFQVLREFSD